MKLNLTRTPMKTIPRGSRSVTMKFILTTKNTHNFQFRGTSSAAALTIINRTREYGYLGNLTTLSTNSRVARHLEPIGSHPGRVERLTLSDNQQITRFNNGSTQTISLLAILGQRQLVNTSNSSVITTGYLLNSGRSLSRREFIPNPNNRPPASNFEHLNNLTNGGTDRIVEREGIFLPISRLETVETASPIIFRRFMNILAERNLFNEELGIREGILASLSCNTYSPQEIKTLLQLLEEHFKLRYQIFGDPFYDKIYDNLEKINKEIKSNSFSPILNSSDLELYRTLSNYKNAPDRIQEISKEITNLKRFIKFRSLKNVQVPVAKVAKDLHDLEDVENDGESENGDLD